MISSLQTLELMFVFPIVTVSKLAYEPGGVAEDATVMICTKSL